MRKRRRERMVRRRKPVKRKRVEGIMVAIRYEEEKQLV